MADLARKGMDTSLTTAIQHFKRQALHATCLSLRHPITQEQMTWNAATPDDMMQLIQLLRHDTTHA